MLHANGYLAALPKFIVGSSKEKTVLFIVYRRRAIFGASHEVGLFSFKGYQSTFDMF